MRTTPQHTDPTTADPQANVDEQRFVVFRLEAQTYALPLECVERVVRMAALTPVPEAPEWVAGALNVHGRSLPVLDLKVRFAQAAKEPHPDERLLIVSLSEQSYALRADAVDRVLAASVHEVEPPTGPLAQSRPLSALVRHGDELTLVLDPERLLADRGSSAIRGVGEGEPDA